MDISYQIIRSNRKTIAIQIKPSGKVIVRCPRKMSIKEIEGFLTEKQFWIEKHLSKCTISDEPPFTKREMEQFRMQARKLVEARVRYYMPIIGVRANRISIRAQKTRWGSCSSKGNLNFNCLLALLPPEVLDYVVVHELCHLKQMNHSKEFWDEVGRVLPDYRASKLWLNEKGSALIGRIE